MSDARPPASVAAVQAAAVDRALADEAAARDHLALVGTLEPARRTAARDHLASAATALLAVRLLDGTDGGSVLPPTPGDGAPAPAVEGAAVAHRRFGVAADRAAALAGVPLGTLLATLD